MNCLIAFVLAATATAQDSGSFIPQFTPEEDAGAVETAYLTELPKTTLAAMAYHHPQALLSVGFPVVTPDGFIADTPEVAVAKVAHLAAKAGLAKGFYQYHQPLLSIGTPVVTPDGFIADTPEVAAAKAAHFAFKAQAEARVLGVNSTPDYLKAFILPSNLRTAFIWTSSYTGPIAFPVVTPQGFLENTPEVVSGKSAHFRAHLARRQEQSLT